MNFMKWLFLLIATVATIAPTGDMAEAVTGRIEQIEFRVRELEAENGNIQAELNQNRGCLPLRFLMLQKRSLESQIQSNRNLIAKYCKLYNALRSASEDFEQRESAAVETLGHLESYRNSRFFRLSPWRLGAYVKHVFAQSDVRTAEQELNELLEQDPELVHSEGRLVSFACRALGYFVFYSAMLYIMAHTGMIHISLG